MKLPGPLDASGSDVQGTTPGPGQGQERDARLDGEVARVTPRVDLPDVASSPDLDGVDAAIAEGRSATTARRWCATCEGVGWVKDPLRGRLDLLGLMVCPGCGGVRASSR